MILGFVNPEAIAGRHPCASSRSWPGARCTTDVAGPLGLSLEDAAHGVFGVATATMARAVKAVTTYRGRDPRDFALLAFGGNGPIFAAALAESLGIRHVRVPDGRGRVLGPRPARGGGGMASQPLRVRGGRLLRAGRPARHASARWSGPLAAELAERGARDATVAWGADVRYAGQGYDLAIPIERGTAARPARRPARATRFHEAHARAYGHAARAEEIELVNVRVTASCRARARSRGRRPRTRPASTSRTRVAGSRGRAAGGAGASGGRTSATAGAGPLLIEEFDTTTVRPARLDRARSTTQHTIVMERDA